MNVNCSYVDSSCRKHMESIAIATDHAFIDHCLQCDVSYVEYEGYRPLLPSHNASCVECGYGDDSQNVEIGNGSIVVAIKCDGCNVISSYMRVPSFERNIPLARAIAVMDYLSRQVYDHAWLGFGWRP